MNDVVVGELKNRPVVSPSLFPAKFSTALVYDLRTWPNCWSFFSDSSLFNLFNIFG